MRPLLACLLALPLLAADTTQIAITPLNLNFAWQTGQLGSAVQAVVLTSPQTGVFTVTRPASAPWLVFAGASGTALSGTYPTVISVAVNGANMKAGTYNSSLQFQIGSMTLPVNVSMQVSAMPVLLADPGMIAFDGTAYASGVNPVTTVGIYNSSGTFVLMSAKPTTPWITVKSTGSTVQVTADPSKVPSDVATGSFSVTTTGGVANSPLVIPVVYLKKGLLSAGPNITRMVNAATYLDSTGISPGEIVTLGGTAIGPATAAGLALNPDGTVATTIGEVQVLFNGTPGPMVYASQNLISAVAPYELAGSTTVSVQVVYNGVGSNAMSLPVAAAAPGIFTANSAGTGPGAILNQDYSVNSPSNPAAKGSVVTIYATGEGQTSPQGVTGAVTPISANTPAPAEAVTAQIAGQEAQVLFAGEAPGFVSGVLQVNVQVPANAASGDLPVAVSVGGVPSQDGVTVSVR